MNEENFHKAIHRLVGNPVKQYKIKRIGKRTTRIPYESPHSTYWCNATVNLKAQKVVVDIYLNFQKNSLNASDFKRIQKLAIDGIGSYWSRSLKVDGKLFNVVVKPHHRVNDSIDIDLYLEKDSDYSRSFNVGIFGIDASFKYNQGFFSATPARADDDFKLVAAHEFGHSVLQNFGGEFFSWSHKGSTHVIPQSVKSITPGYPSSGSIDLMKYFDHKKGGVSFPRLIRDSKANEQDVLRLVWLSVIEFI